MKHVSVRDAVGMVLCHDVTRIVPGEYKGPAFKKGHIITPADIAPLLDLGKAVNILLDTLREVIEALHPVRHCVHDGRVGFEDARAGQ